MSLKKGLAVVLACATASLAFAGCAQSSGNTIKIGGLAPLTGDVSVYGTAVSKGANLAIEEVNAAGGILGKQIEFIEQDEEGDPVKAVNAYNKLSSQKVVAIIGDVTSKPTISVAQKAAKDNMPMISASATAAEVTTYGSNMFRACYLDPYQGEIMATYATQNLGAKNAAVLYDTSDDYSKGCAEAFKAKVEAAGATVVAYEGFGKGDTDFKAQLTKINQSTPDVLFIPSYYNTVALIATQAKEVGVTATLLGSDGWDGVIGALDAGNVGVVEGAYFGNHYSTQDPSEVIQKFLTDYKKKYNEDPNAFAALGYDSAKILIAAIQKAGNTDKAAIIKAMSETDYEGVTGHITYNGSGDPVKSVAIIRIANGAYTLDSKVTPQ